MKRGQLQQAYDLCASRIAHDPDDLWLRHRAVLCLVRSGALERASDAYDRYRLAEARHDEDCLALGARLTKTQALEAEGAAFTELSARAAQGYQAVYEQTGGHYPGINAASMFALAGSRERAAHLASQVLELCATARPTDDEAAYYLMATRAEANLLLGDVAAAHLTLKRAIERDRDNHAALASTLRQFRLLTDRLGLDASWLTDLEPPHPAHFAGRLFRLGADDGAMDTATATRLARQLDVLMTEARIGALYGAMAAGSDIMIAEAALRHGREINVVLPVPANIFIEASVRPLGRDWVRRCETCLGSAASLREVSRDRVLQSRIQIRFASEIAMGLARMHADVLSTQPLQILVADPGEIDGDAGTDHDRRIWSAAGLSQHVLPIKPAVRYRADSSLAGDDADADFAYRLRAMLFIDVCGSSSVPDDRTPAFVDGVLGRLVRVCESLDPVPLYSDSWGDGLFLAFDTVADAARAAVRLMASFPEIDLAGLGLPDDLAIRIGGHYGPVHLGRDPLQKRESLFGNQVAIAARIEPCAVPGSILVSEAFAAALSMSPGDFRCEYVGQTRIDAHFPDMQLYSLRAVSPGSPASQRTRGPG